MVASCHPVELIEVFGDLRASVPELVHHYKLVLLVAGVAREVLYYASFRDPQNSLARK